MPEIKRVKRRYLSLNKDNGGLKEKVGETIVEYHNWAAELVDFCFRDDEYQNRISRQLEITLREFNEDGEEEQFILRTSSFVWVDGFLNLIANAPSAGDAHNKEYLSIGAYKPDDKQYLYCWMAFVTAAGERKITKLYDAEQTKEWCQDPMKPTEGERALKEKRLLSAAVRWRAQHLPAVDSHIFHYDINDRVVAQHNDSAYVAPDGGEAAPPADPNPTAGTSYAGFVNALKGAASPEDMSTAEVLPADRDKAAAFQAHYVSIWDGLVASDIPEDEAAKLKKGDYKKAPWPKVVDHILETLKTQGLVADPGSEPLPGEDGAAASLAPGGAPEDFDDDLPF